jgi:hypothetical protein
VEKNANSKTPEVAQKPVPQVLSINVCDSIIRDETTRKVTLVGLFNTIRANSFPCIHPLMHVYISMTNGHGKYKADVRFVSADDDAIIAGMQGDLEFKNPLQVVELNLCWQGLSFKKDGEYVFEVLCDGNHIGQRKFRVIGPTQKTPPTGGTEVA